MKLKVNAVLDPQFQPLSLLCREMREATKDNGQDLVIGIQRNKGYITTYKTFVGKLKLKNGQYDWKYTNLNSAGRFEKFQHIKFPSKREVVFVAPHPFSLESDTVVINDMTGEIIRMN